MHSVFWNVQAMLALAYGSDQAVPESLPRTVEARARRQALDALDTSIKQMHGRARLEMSTADRACVRVWRVGNIKVQGGQLYINRWRPYVTTEDGPLRPLDWSELATDDINFAALTLGLDL